jgi:hypothetical protein
LGARLVRVDELGALGLARLLEVGAGIHRVFVVGPVEWTGAKVSGKVVSTEISHASDSEGRCEPGLAVDISRASGRARVFRGRGSRLVVASGAFTRGVRRVDGGVVASGAFTWDGQATAPTQRPPPSPHPMIARCKIIRGERDGETRAIAGRGRITGGMVTRMWCERAGWGTYIFASALRGCVASSRVATRASALVRVRHSVTGWRVISPD